MTPNIKIAQINLQHAVAVSAVITHKMATDNLGVVLAQEPWTCKKFISIVLVAMQIRTKEEEGSGDNIVVAYGNFPGDSNIIPIPKSELLIDYCKKERTPLVIGCDTNAQKQHGKVPTTKLELASQITGTSLHRKAISTAINGKVELQTTTPPYWLIFIELHN
ncbi:uncharacterized protein LOC110118432 [Ceratitis capitata]|uniref:uncharacterized protein LOC110118432 n=1 Tax=Ceratitis capitata TaxID=7213 RepID=UPI000C6C5A70|nr:uncharacterized protein LOC110118432 [Ceratitis capitata]